MIDIKPREHDRKHHFDHSKPPEEHQNELQRSLVDQLKINLVITIDRRSPLHLDLIASLHEQCT